MDKKLIIKKKKKRVHLDHELKGIFMPKLIWEPLVLFRVFSAFSKKKKSFKVFFWL